MNLYENSIITKLNYNADGEVVSVKLNESQLLGQRGFIQLSQYPDHFHRVFIKTTGTENYLNEVHQPIDLKANHYFVNYTNGLVFFNTDNVGTSFDIEYYGKGVELISTNRMIHKYDVEGEVVHEALDDLIDSRLEKMDNIIETGEEAVNHLIETNESVKANEEERVKTFNEIKEYVAEEIVSKDSEFQSQLTAQQDEYRAQLNQQELEHQTQLEMNQESFEDKVEEWQGVIETLQVVEGVVEAQPSTAVKRDENGDINVNKQVTFDEGNVLASTNEALTYNDKKVVLYNEDETITTNGKLHMGENITLEVNDTQGLNLIADSIKKTVPTVSEAGIMDSIIQLNLNHKPLKEVGGALAFNGANIHTQSNLPVEVGVFAPKLSSSAGEFETQNNSGQYYKIGNLVYATAYILAETSVGTGTDLVITNLPFSGKGLFTPACIGLQWGFKTGASFSLAGVLKQHSNAISLVQNSHTGSGSYYAKTSDILLNSSNKYRVQLSVSIVYEAI